MKSSPRESGFRCTSRNLKGVVRLEVEWQGRRVRLDVDIESVVDLVDTSGQVRLVEIVDGKLMVSKKAMGGPGPS
jgi:hypothetical protein